VNAALKQARLMMALPDSSLRCMRGVGVDVSIIGNIQRTNRGRQVKQYALHRGLAYTRKISILELAKLYMLTGASAKALATVRF
ncbi:MAG: hypothetical protein ACREDR_40725, partial [Blastocatellia bacterium]